MFLKPNLGDDDMKVKAITFKTSKNVLSNLKYISIN